MHWAETLRFVFIATNALLAVHKQTHTKAGYFYLQIWNYPHCSLQLRKNQSLNCLVPDCVLSKSSTVFALVIKEKMTADKPLCHFFTISMPTLLMLNYWQPQWFGLFSFLSVTGFLSILRVLEVETFRGEWVTTCELQWRTAEQVLGSIFFPHNTFFFKDVADKHVSQNI